MGPLMGMAPIWLSETAELVQPPKVQHERLHWMIDYWLAGRCLMAALYSHCDAGSGTRPDQWTGKAPGLTLCHPHFGLATNWCCDVGTCSLAGILKWLAGLLLHSWLAGMGHCRSPDWCQSPAGWLGRVAGLGHCKSPNWWRAQAGWLARPGHCRSQRH